MQTDPARKEEVQVAVEEKTETIWRVFLFNDDIHSFEEVIDQLIKATACSVGRAEDLAWTVHREGKAMVFDGEFETCFAVQSILKEIGLVTEIRG